VVLALIAERAAGVPFHDLVDRYVCQPAGMSDTAYLRSDELPPRTATGYLPSGSRSNVLHLPVRGSGDGGIYSTAADLAAFWSALFAGRIVPPDRLADMLRPRSDVTPGSTRYGLGFWLRWSGRGVFLDGYDAGVSFRSAHDPETGVTHTVISNTSDGAWPMTRRVEELLGTPAGG
jgi:CubicO group peptidase (beta-lactamase class C family)